MTSESSKVDPVLQTDDHAHEPRGQLDAAVGGAPSGSQTLGSRLRDLRESRGWSVGDVCARLKFAPRQIEALEADQWESLPQGPSLRGMVRNYARLLDADPEAYLAALPAHLQAQPAPMGRVNNLSGVAELPAGSTLPGTAGAGRGRGLGWGAAILLLLALIGLAAYLFFAWWLPRSQGVSYLPEVALPFAESVNGEEGSMASGTIQGIPELAPAAAPNVAFNGGVQAPVEPAENSAVGTDQVSPESSGGVAAVTPNAATQEPTATNSAQVATVLASPTGPFVVPGLSAEAVPAQAAEPEPPPPAVVPNQLVLQAQQASWVEVRDANGSVVLSVTLQPGEERELQAEPPARLVIGNANGVTVSWQGENVDLAQYQRGNVARFTLQ